MRVNLGCGEYKADGWVNVDCYAGVAPDVVAELGRLPFDDGEADQIYAGHVFEHVAMERLPMVLLEVARVLASDGTLMVVGPDLDRALASWPEVVDEIKSGPSGSWPGAAHLWDCRESLMLQVLIDAGFEAAPLSIEAVPSAWPVVSRIGWQFAIECQ